MDSQRLGERVLEQRVQVRDRFEPVATTDVRVHRSALDRTGPYQCHLDHQVVETAGFQPRQCRHLGPRLDLEDPDRVGPLEHLVDRGFLWKRRQVDLDPVMRGQGLPELELLGRKIERRHPGPAQGEGHRALGAAAADFQDVPPVEVAQ